MYVWVRVKRLGTGKTQRQRRGTREALERHRRDEGE
jgi:hypothetical protein